MKSIEKALQHDVEVISRIPIIPAILDVICKTTGMGFAAVARVTEDRWIACQVKDDIAFGMKPGGELQIETTICNEIRQMRKAVIIDHVDKDPDYCGHHTPKMYGFQSYISVPIFKKDGSFFGTLCAIDPRPALLNNPQTISMFELFCELIAFHMDTIEKLEFSEKNLLEERQVAELRDQFIAILGHDLRNPLSSVMMAAELLSEELKDHPAYQVAVMIRNSSHRMAGLINNVLDFARGRLGEGLVVEKKENVNLENVLTPIIEEFKPLWQERTIITNFDLQSPVETDKARIGQLFSNLRGNALIHGDKESPVVIDAVSHEKGFEFSVHNKGSQIPESSIEKLFQPFYRGRDKSGKEGLGLGLYIASEIAKAHGGQLSVRSTDEITSFTLKAVK